MSWLTASPWPILVLAFVGTGLLIAAAWLMERRAMERYVGLITTGEAATATVLSAKDTGWRTNGRPHIAFKLEVRREGRPPYTATARLQLARKWSPVPYGPGTVLRVRVDRDRPELVAIEGGEPVLGGARVSPESGGAAAFAAGAGQVYVVGGTASAGVEDLPPEVRAMVERVMGVADPAERLRTLKGLYDEGLITAEEYEARRAAIVEQL